MAGWLHEFRLRLAALVRKRRLAAEMEEELALHQSLMREKLMAQGAQPAEAEREVRRRFGNAGRWRERCAELWQFRLVEELWRDGCFSMRMLRKSPGFTAVALLTLALGIGANTAIFSVMDALLLRPLPVPAANELTVLSKRGGSSQSYDFCAPLLRTLEKRRDIFANVFGYFDRKFQTREGGNTVEVSGSLVSGQYFDALGVKPALGRSLTPSDDVAGGNPAGLGVVISDHFWKTHFQRAPDILGRKLILDRVAFTVVGVMPKDFIGASTTERPQLFVPIALEPLVDAPINMTAGGYHSWWLQMGARMKPGWTLEQTNAALHTGSQAMLNEAIPDMNWSVGDSKRSQDYFDAEPGASGYSWLGQQFRKPLLAVLTLCGALLLLSCLNLASLLMARSAAREREIATRVALGATRRRVVQQLMMESLVLSALGTAAGLLAAPWVARLLATMLGGKDFQFETGLDLRVLLFTGGVALLSGLAIGFAPALQSTSSGIMEQIKNGSRTAAGGHRRSTMPRVLMTIEVGLALVLVVGAGLLSTTLFHLRTVGLGFNAQNLLFAGLSMGKQPAEGAALMRIYADIATELSHQPGVERVAYAQIVPMGGSSWQETLHVPGHEIKNVWMNATSSGYFATMGIPVLAGRDFNERDTPVSGRKIVLNQSAARMLFGKRNPVGQQLKSFGDKDTYEVIGLVRDAKYQDVRKADPPGGYVAVSQEDIDKKPDYSLLIRIHGPAGPVAAALRDVVHRVAPDVPAPAITSMDALISRDLISERMMTMLAVFFAGCALLVTGIGLYGTLAYSTARRTSEIGIRIALGAQRLQVVRMVLKENLWIASAGVVVGLVVAVMTSKLLASFLYATSPHSPGVMALAAAVLAVVAGSASAIPAARAAMIDPAAAIRSE